MTSLNSNQIVELFIKNRNLIWRLEKATPIVNHDFEMTSILLTEKQWNWLRNVYQDETKYYRDIATGHLENGISWSCEYTGYYRKNRNGSAKLTLTREV